MNQPGPGHPASRNEDEGQPALRKFGPGQPSRTAIAAMAQRAIGARNPEEAMRNPDYLAERFFGPREQLAVESTRLPELLKLDFSTAIERMRKTGTDVWVGSLLSRTKHIDEALRQAVAGGAQQIVILGAGFDTRAYRLAELLRGLPVFEADFPATQEYKKERVLEVLGALPPGLVYVPVNFATGDLAEALRQGGYSPERKTFFIWEAVALYIPRSAVEKTLAFVTACSAPGSSIVIEYAPESAIHTESRDERARELQERFERWGEPLVFGFPGDEAAGFLGGLGLQVISDFGGAELTKMYATRPDGTVLAPVAWWQRICVAMTPEPPTYNRAMNPT